MIELKNISKTYVTGKIAFEALGNIDLKIEPGEFVAIIGPSGSGKSTLLHILGLLDRPDSGSYKFFGRELNRLNDSQRSDFRKCAAGFIFQQFHLMPRLRVLENVELPLAYVGAKHLKERAREKIKKVGLSPKERNRSNELSGGEQQRVAIARALVNEPPIILADEPTGNLDARTEKEIIAILESLNREGKTVIIVTHEKEIAECAGRVISMRDGKIISDLRTKTDAGLPKTATFGTSSPDILAWKSPTIKGAELVDHLREGLGAIFTHKMRSMLSVLGILIGIAAVIAMLAFVGVKESISEELFSMGSNVMTLIPGAYLQRGIALETGKVTRFTLDEADEIEAMPLVKRASAVVSDRAQLDFANRNWNTTVRGTDADYNQIHNINTVKGRYFTKAEVKSRQKVAVLGSKVAEELFKKADAVGKSLKISRIDFQVIGVFPERGIGPSGDEDDSVSIPVTTAMYRLMGRQYVDTIDIEVADLDSIDEAKKEVGRLIKRNHRLPENDTDSFDILTTSEILKAMESTTKSLSWLLGSIACVALLVGGIGIMNIMLVSVTERTREIGLRKAIGAKETDILNQFLIESLAMSLIGGALGIIFGYAAAEIIAAFAKWSTKVSLFSIILATSFSAFIGVCFGIWPAIKASRLDVVEALRYE